MSLLQGIKVVEVAIYAFVPSAGAALADWGADVVKIEHPETGEELSFSSPLPADLLAVLDTLA